MRPCFETPGEGELVARGSKLVGSAQWRDEGALLQHGSILVEDDQSSLPSFAAVSTGASSASIPPPATLHALLGRAPAVAEVASAMFDAVRSLEDEDATELAEEEVRGEIMSHIPLFLDEGWTWRR
jgi:lipoate-protein ligase A